MKMEVGLICIKTTDGMTFKIGPFVFDDKLSDLFIRNKIHETTLEYEYDYYDMIDVEDIVVIFTSGDFDGIYSPNIEDVWPHDFGPENLVNRDSQERR